MAKHNRPASVMPIWTPPFGQPPYPMERAEMLFIEFEANREEIERITPEPFEPATHNRLKAFFADNRQPPVSFGFHEVAIVQEVYFEGKKAFTIPYIWVSDDLAMLAGRELYGMTKLLCDKDKLRVHANQIYGALARDGVTMMEGSMVVEREAEPDEFPFDGSPFAFERHVPSIEPGGPSLRQVIWAEITELAAPERCWFGDGHLEIRHPLLSGLKRLEPIKPLSATYGVYSWMLDWGKVVHQEEVPAAEILTRAHNQAK
jgi:acetoacetate decarboxylase